MGGTGQALAGFSVLVVEDEYIVASLLAAQFTRAGIKVVGPVGNIEEALRILADTPVDAAVLDLDLRGEKAYDIADRLIALEIPFVLATGYDDGTIPARFAGIVRCRKPTTAQAVLDALTTIIEARGE
jgi:CheY-like chemotaxis protein